jgi:hypothetical protein
MPDIEIPQFDYEEDNDGTMTVTYTAENTSDTEQSDTITVQVRAGQDNYERQSDMEIPPGETVEKAESFDVAVDDFRGDGSINFDWDKD